MNHLIFLIGRDHSVRYFEQIFNFYSLHVQNDVEWALMKINHYCFLLQEAEIQSCIVMQN